MRNLIVLVTLLFSVSALAQQMPKYLEGATVTVTLKNGKTYDYKSEEMAVVKRDSMGQLVAAQAVIKKVDKALKEKKIVPNKRNRVYVLGGIGNSGKLKTKTDGSRYKTQIDDGEVFGVGIQRKINDGDYNIGIQLQNNGTTSLSLGHDF
jgi:hypothetical protein